MLIPIRIEISFSVDPQTTIKEIQDCGLGIAGKAIWRGATHATVKELNYEAHKVDQDLCCVFRATAILKATLDLDGLNGLNFDAIYPDQEFINARQQVRDYFGLKLCDRVTIYDRITLERFDINFFEGDE